MKRNRLSLSIALLLGLAAAAPVLAAESTDETAAADAGDGQGNCNLVRTNAANLLTAWLAADPTGTGDPDVLITGDLNAYAMEDPITAIQSAGYTNLIAQFNGASAYSYVFDGQSGYLDHALATANLALQVSGVVEYHINADEPIVLDYNTEFKTAGQLVSLYTALKFRASDHDPVVVGLNLNNDPVANDLSLTTNEDVPAGSLLAGSDLDGDPLTIALGSGPAHGTVVLNADNTFTYTPALNYFGADSFTFIVSDGRGGSDTGTVSITVNPINDNPAADDLTFSIDENTLLNASVTASDVDGDTLSFDGLKVGLWGISAPEAKQACGKTKAGILSTKALHDLADGRRVVCEMRDFDAKEKRPVAVCMRDGEDIASEIVESGWAWDSKSSKGAYAAQEGKAKDALRGLHILSCDSPAKWRAQQKAALKKRERKS